MDPKKALDDAAKVLRQYLPAFTHAFRDAASVNNFYQPVDNFEWTPGFCTGQYWLAYEHTGEAAFREAALTQADSFLWRAENHIGMDNHDMGFLYTPSCVAAYKLAGSENGKKAALLAADALLARFREKGQFFQAWGAPGAADNYRMIIDCLLNLPLLYWATEITGQPVYREKALAHTKTSLNHLFRADGSTCHTFFFDGETGAPLRGVTHQGRHDGSAWARGQAWGVYGLALAYRYSREPRCADVFCRVTDFFIARLPEDSVPYWDLEFTDGDGEPKDSSAAAIAACGMLEMAKYLPPETARRYSAKAHAIADSLARGYAVRDAAVSNGLLLHGVYNKSTPENTVLDQGVDECTVWGDYFWMELLTRLAGDWESYW